MSGAFRLLDDGSVALVIWNGGPLLPDLPRNNRPLGDDAPGSGVTDAAHAARTKAYSGRRRRMIEVQRSAAARIRPQRGAAHKGGR